MFVIKTESIVTASVEKYKSKMVDKTLSDRTSFSGGMFHRHTL